MPRTEEEKARNADHPALAAACARVNIRHTREQVDMGITVSESESPGTYMPAITGELVLGESR